MRVNRFVLLLAVGIMVVAGAFYLSNQQTSVSVNFPAGGNTMSVPAARQVVPSQGGGTKLPASGSLDGVNTPHTGQFSTLPPASGGTFGSFNSPPPNSGQFSTPAPQISGSRQETYSPGR
jgi:hypothetical protein